MNDKRPNSRRNLDFAIDRNFPSNSLEIRTVMASTIVGQMLPGGVVKGGSALKFRYGDSGARFSRDVDTARVREASDFISKLEASLQEGWNGFTGHLVFKDPAKPKGIPSEYVMQPYEVKLAYNNKSWVTVPLEVGHNEIGDADVPDYVISGDVIAIFELLGFPAPDPIPLMQLEHQVAQKLHAVSAKGSQRAHDLVDLQLIVTNGTIDYSKTKAICQRLFVYRKQQTWPPAVIEGEDWDRAYDAQSKDLQVLATADEATKWVNDFIKRIEEAN